MSDVMLRKLAAAKAGDEEAIREVAIHCFERFKGRLHKFYNPVDPAISLEDMEMTFFEGIMRAIPHADHRGDPLYHLGQRGVWAVQSELRTVKRLMAKRTTLVATSPGVDPWVEFEDTHEDRAASDDFEILHERIDAIDRVRVLTGARLDVRSRQAVELIMTCDDLQPNEIGFNKALAEAMDVSPQRSSQITQALEAATWRAEAYSRQSRLDTTPSHNEIPA